MELVKASEFARLAAVSRQAVSKAIKAGRIIAYDATGARVAADHAGQKFVDKDTALKAFALSRHRLDDATLDEVSRTLQDDAPAPASDGSGTLTGARRDSEQLKGELLRIRIARERGEHLSRAAIDSAMETAGRDIAREVDALPGLAEEIFALARAGDLPQLIAFLRAKATAIKTAMADKLVLDPEAGPDTDDDGDAGADLS